MHGCCTDKATKPPTLLPDAQARSRAVSSDRRLRSTASTGLNGGEASPSKTVVKESVPPRGSQLACALHIMGTRDELLTGAPSMLAWHAATYPLRDGGVRPTSIRLCRNSGTCWPSHVMGPTWCPWHQRPKTRHSPAYRLRVEPALAPRIVCMTLSERPCASRRSCSVAQRPGSTCAGRVEYISAGLGQKIRTVWQGPPGDRQQLNQARNPDLWLQPRSVWANQDEL